MNDSRVLIPNRIYFRIGDVAEIIGVKPYVIRFWEGEFPFLAPDKASSGQRVYRRSQIESLVLVKHLLHVERYSIEGAKKKLTELRKQAKLKEAMQALIENPASPATQIEVGSKVSKSELPLDGVAANLKDDLQELQSLIRDPSHQGHEVPGLKSTN